MRIKELVSDERYLLIFLSCFVFLTGFILCFFRYAKGDEIVYIYETNLIAELIKNGEYPGDYPVGIHGFLFKLPAAFLFVLFGPSVFAVTITNVIYGVIASALGFKIFNAVLQNPFYSFCASLLFVTNYNFLITLPTYNREISAVLALLFFMYNIMMKKNKWICGLSLMLVLDAKEYVFFMILPGYLLWIIIDEMILRQTDNLIVCTAEIFKRVIFSLFPSLIFIYLMFCTSIIPLNIYTAYILNFVKKGFENEKEAFTPRASAAGWDGQFKMIYQIQHNKK